MLTILYLLIIFFLFFILGKSADSLIFNVKKIAEKLKINKYIIGIIFGILTTTPELFVGINAIKNNIGSISIGNLFGGIILLFTLLLGIDLILNKKIKTDGNIKNILPSFLFILLGIITGLKGYFNFYDGIFFIFLYFTIVFYINKTNNINEYELNILNKKNDFSNDLKNIFLKKNVKKEIVKEILISIISIITLLITSDIIIDLSIKILSQFNISKFFIGLIMFSIGTNLPELTVVLRAFKNKDSELSLSHLIGSAMANIFILSILSLFNNFKININFSYILLLITTIISSILIILFYKTNKEFSRNEGYSLVLIYIIFIIAQFLYEVAWA